MRSFIGLTPEKRAKQALKSQLEGLKKITDIRWIPEDRWHLTLKFLDEITAVQVQSLSALLSDLCRQVLPVSLCLQSGGVFPRRQNPKIFWCGLGGEVNNVVSLANQINARCLPLGFSMEEKSFKPHITVGRMNRNFRREKAGNYSDHFCKLLSTFRSGVFVIREIHLFQSRLEPNGAHYTVLKSFPLGMS